MSEQTFSVVSLRKIALRVTAAMHVPLKMIKQCPMYEHEEEGEMECCTELEGDIDQAILNRHYECIKRAHVWSQENGDTWAMQNLYDLLEIGEIKFVKYALANGRSFDKKCIFHAIRSNKMDVVQYVIKAVNGGVWDEDVLKYALKAKSFKFVKYAHKRGAPWAHDSMDIAVRATDIELLQYMLKKRCPWTGETMIKAVKTENSNVVQFCHENGCPYDKDTLMDVCMTTTSLDILKYAFEVMQCKFTPKSMGGAMGHRQFKLVKYAYSNGCPWTKGSINGGYWDRKSWKFAVNNGFVWDEDMMKEAVSIGSFKFVKCIHEQGIPLPHNSMESAVILENVPLLKYMLDNGCSWTENTMDMAIRTYNLDVIKFCHENGCPYDKNYVVCIEMRNSTRDILKYTKDVMGLNKYNYIIV
jgi:hypothetical protein